MRHALGALLWILSLLVAGWGAFEGSRRLAHPDDDLRPLASFQGQSVLRKDIENYYPAYRTRAVGELILARLAAEACGEHPDTQSRSDIYLRKLLAREWPERRLRDLFNLFKDELTCYELEALRPGEPRRKVYTGATLEEKFGPKYAELLKRLPVGGECKVSSGVRLRLHCKRSRFEDLRPDLEARILQTRRAALVNQLLARAHIQVMGPLGDDAGVLEFGL